MRHAAWHVISDGDAAVFDGGSQGAQWLPIQALDQNLMVDLAGELGVFA